MCGRFAATISREILERLYRLDIGENIVPRYNIAPSQYSLVLRLNPANGERELVSLKWGFVPAWTKELPSGSGIINARAESVSVKPAFKRDFRRRRALVPASGFYEWKGLSGKKKPYLIQRRDRGPFSMAGLWERWEGGVEVLESFALITVAAGQKLAAIHHRMPLIIAEPDYCRWLDPASSEADLSAMFRPFPEELLTVYPVSNIVNYPAHDQPECLAPLDDTPGIVGLREPDGLGKWGKDGWDEKL